MSRPAELSTGDIEDGHIEDGHIEDGQTRGSQTRGGEVAAVDAGHNLRWLYTGRALRSFGTAFLTVIFPLYLAAQGYSAAVIGVILTAGGFVSAALMAGVGIAGDRFGRRPMLVGLGLVGALGAGALAGTGNLAVVTLANGLGGVGRGGGAGSGGSWGPFFPAEQPLLASSVPASRRTAAFGHLSFVGVLAGAAGSLVAFLPALLHSAGASLLDGYRAVFVLGAICSAGVVAVSLPLREAGPAPGTSDAASPLSREESTTEPAEIARAGDALEATPALPGATVPGATVPGELTTRQLVSRLSLTNALNGFGFGFLGPLLTYWFYVRFGAGPADLAILYMLVNLLSALPYLGSARLTRRLGAVRTVVWSRAVSIVLLLAMAIAPDFAWAGALFALRMAVNSLSIPARQSFAMGVAEERRRGTVAAVGSLPSLVTSSMSPAIGGALMEELLATPLLGAALFMGANTVAYYLAFRRTKPPEERSD